MKLKKYAKGFYHLRTRVSKIKKSKGQSAPKGGKVSDKTEKIINTMTMKEIAEKAKKEVADLTGFKSPSLVGVKKEGGGWVLSIELVEKNSIPEGMDILGLYEVKTDAGGDVTGYERKSSRRRTDTIGEGSEAE